MLDGLDTIDWASLTHAYGEASNVPGLIRSLASADADVWTQACAELHETIWHQGTIYSASAAAVPFLFELLTYHSTAPLDPQRDLLNECLLISWSIGTCVLLILYFYVPKDAQKVSDE